MLTLLILSIVFTVAAIVLSITFFVTYDNNLEFYSGVASIICLVTTLVLWVTTASIAENRRNEEVNRVCAERGGVVTKDNHCFKDNKPIEFSPGVWQK